MSENSDATLPVGTDPSARHEGTQFEPVPRDAAATSRPYPPEADPDPQESTEPAQVPGEQADPTRRAAVFPEDSPADDREHVVPGSGEPPD